MAWEPLAQAPETVKLMPLRLNIVARFMVMVEFIDWNMLLEPTSMVFFFSRMMSVPRITASAQLSLP